MNVHLQFHHNPEGVEAGQGIMFAGCNPFRVDDDLSFPFTQGRPGPANPGLAALHAVGVKEENLGVNVPAQARGLFQ